MAKTRTPTINEIKIKLVQMGFTLSKENVQLKHKPVLYDTITMKHNDVYAEKVKEPKPKYQTGKKH